MIAMQTTRRIVVAALQIHHHIFVCGGDLSFTEYFQYRFTLTHGSLL